MPRQASGRLRRADLAAPGLTRRKAGKGFVFLDPAGKRIDEPATLNRIRALVIPPAWIDVWICTDPLGHVQAMGTDARGRRQYRYHDKWRLRRDREKFAHMIEFAAALPRLRATIAEHLQHPDLDRERVLACATRLLDLGFFRIGTEGYAEENQTFGLATMLRRHVRVKDDVVVFDYTAKSGKRRVQAVADPAVLEVVTALKARTGGGKELLAYQRESAWSDVRSTDINAYLQEVTGGEFTAKDFRTWNATVLAAVALAVSTPARSATARKRAVARACQEVSAYLGNTPAVCRSSYIDPRIVDRYQSGITVAASLEHIGDAIEVGQPSTQGLVERAVLELLIEDSDEISGIEELLATA
ncbi:MAG TPA: hypothetical protein VMY34_10805 [Acidimicrobiales bacterium]|nr:hypothetical protein [Acidimicrobiales bacterium]